LGVHVAHVIARLNDGGPARVIAVLGRELARGGHRLTVLAGACGPDEPDLTAAVAEAGLTVERVPGLQRGLRPGAELRAAAALARRLRQLAPDVVHTHTAKAGVLGRLACRWLGLPCVHTYHGHVLHGYFGRAGEAGVRACERAVAGNAWHHALTPTQLTDLRDRAHIGRRTRWRVLPPPVPVVARAHAGWHARLRPGVPVLGFLGRLAPIKDGALWLESLAALARRRHVQGVVCGDGQERAALEARARALGVDALFVGFVPAAEALGASDALLITSRNEGLPLAAVEAASAGVPVVAPPVGGLADVIRWGGALGAHRDADSLADACALLLGDARARAAQIARGRRFARALAPEALAPRYERLYREVAGAA
jgi:glycosyltransferase involved in cell wall biosynthesis